MEKPTLGHIAVIALVAFVVVLVTIGRFAPATARKFTLGAAPQPPSA